MICLSHRYLQTLILGGAQQGYTSTIAANVILFNIADTTRVPSRSKGDKELENRFRTR
jgi:hypothetical protein